jgi:hypothetical protein
MEDLGHGNSYCLTGHHGCIIHADELKLSRVEVLETGVFVEPPIDQASYNPVKSDWSYPASSSQKLAYIGYPSS